MLGRLSISTDEFGVSKFQSHGRVDYKIEGSTLCAIASGPFNMELMGALLEMAKVVFPEMASNGPWVSITVFHNSALCSLEVMHALTEAMRQMMLSGIHPMATAFILSPDVEGAHMMGPLFEKAYADAGAMLKCFANYDAGMSWLMSVGPPVTTCSHDRVN